MTTPLLFVEDSSIDEVNSESFNIETEAMFEAMGDIAENEDWMDTENAVVLDL